MDSSDKTDKIMMESLYFIDLKILMNCIFPIKDLMNKNISNQEKE